MGTKADMMKEYYKAKISLRWTMQISNEKYKTLLVDNKEDDVPKLLLRISKMMLINLLADSLLDQSH